VRRLSRSKVVALIKFPAAHAMLTFATNEPRPTDEPLAPLAE
jgi:hypothetical protein